MNFTPQTENKFVTLGIVKQDYVGAYVEPETSTVKISEQTIEISTSIANIMQPQESLFAMSAWEMFNLPEGKSEQDFSYEWTCAELVNGTSKTASCPSTIAFTSGFNESTFSVNRSTMEPNRQFTFDVKLTPKYTSSSSAASQRARSLIVTLPIIVPQVRIETVGNSFRFNTNSRVVLHPIITPNDTSYRISWRCVSLATCPNGYSGVYTSVGNGLHPSVTRFREDMVINGANVGLPSGTHFLRNDAQRGRSLTRHVREKM